jgi:hypothetical protein
VWPIYDRWTAYLDVTVVTFCTGLYLFVPPCYSPVLLSGRDSSTRTPLERVRFWSHWPLPIHETPPETGLFLEPFNVLVPLPSPWTVLAQLVNTET